MNVLFLSTVSFLASSRYFHEMLAILLPRVTCVV